MNKYISTNTFSWKILGDNTHILWVRKVDGSGRFSGNFIQFSYYPSKNEMSLDQGVHIECKSIDEANYFVHKVLKVHRVEIPEEFMGRYHKLMKINKICQSVN